MQEKNVWQRSGPRGRIAIACIALFPIFLGFLAGLYALLLPPVQTIPKYPCRLLSASLVEIPPSDGKYRARAEFQYLKSGSGNWTKAKSDNIFLFEPVTFYSAKLMLEELKDSEELICLGASGDFKIQKKPDSEFRTLELFLALVLFYIGWISFVYLFVKLSKNTLRRVILSTCLLVYALSATWLLTQWALTRYQTSKWMAVSCKVDFLNYGKADLPDVLYHYSFQGKTYEGSRVYPSNRGVPHWPGTKLAELSETPGASICYVNPNNPEQACLVKMNAAGFALGLGLALFTCFFPCLIPTAGPRLTWQPANPRRGIAFLLLTCLLIASSLIWAFPGFLTLASSGQLGRAGLYTLAWIVLGLVMFAAKSLFGELGFNRPRIHFSEAITESSESSSFFLDFLDQPDATTVELWDASGGSQLLLDQVNRESQVSFTLPPNPNRVLSLLVRTQGKSWQIPLTGHTTLFDTGSLDTFAIPARQHSSPHRPA